VGKGFPNLWFSGTGKVVRRKCESEWETRGRSIRADTVGWEVKKEGGGSRRKGLKSPGIIG